MPIVELIQMKLILQASTQYASLTKAGSVNLFQHQLRQFSKIRLAGEGFKATASFLKYLSQL